MIYAALKAAREALVPFAEMIGGWTNNGYDKSPDDEVVRSIGTFGRDYAFITVGDLRRAYNALSLIDSAIAPRETATTTEDEVSLLDLLAQHTNWSLSYRSPVYSDDPDQTIRWEIVEQIGNINDREWNIIGFGATPIEALRSLFSLPIMPRAR